MISYDFEGTERRTTPLGVAPTRSEALTFVEFALRELCVCLDVHLVHLTTVYTGFCLGRFSRGPAVNLPGSSLSPGDHEHRFSQKRQKLWL